MERLFGFADEGDIVIHETQVDCLIVDGTLKVDFGAWKAGEKACLTFDFLAETVAEYDDMGQQAKSHYLTIT